MPATATGRGAQVILSGDAQAAARGVFATTIRGNSDALSAWRLAGIVADGSTSDGRTLTGRAAYDPVFAVASAETPDGIQNITPSTFAHWRKALATVRDGSGRGKLLLIGDSTTAGAGAGSGGTTNLTGAYAKAYPAALASLMSNIVPVSHNSFMGGAGLQALGGYTNFDPRVVLGTGWSSNSVVTVGGHTFKFVTGAASTLAFTPVGAIDNFKIWYIRQTPGGSFTTDIDGAASLGTTATGAAGQTVQSVAYTVAKGVHAININAQNDNQIFILGVEAWDSTTPAVDIIQGGHFGSKVSDWLGGSAWGQPQFIPTLAPDLTIICLTINDSNQLISLDAYRTAMQTLITAAKTTGDVLLMVGAPSSTPQATDGTLASYVATLRALAQTNDCGLLDLKTRWTSYAVANAIFPYFDSLHPGALGYQDIAAAVFEAIGTP